LAVLGNVASSANKMLEQDFLQKPLPYWRGQNNGERLHRLFTQQIKNMLIE
jgi:hypothetical protein